MHRLVRRDEMKKPSLIKPTVSFLACLSVLPALATAAEQNVRAETFKFQYAAKILCTANVPNSSQTTPSVLPGTYQTVVNIHNPNDRAVRFRKKIALAVPPAGQRPGNISKFFQEQLGSDRALAVNCEDATKILRDSDILPVHGFEGFLVIESPRSLDVTAVYTAGHAQGDVESIAVEQIKERRK
jgi:hypothetical protein